MTDREMNAHVAVSRWMRGDLNVFQAVQACGNPTMSEMYAEYLEIEANVLAGLRMMTSEEAERDELTDLAYAVYGDLLREEPAYLDQIIEGLEKQKRRMNEQFAAKFNASRRVSKRSNVLPFARH